MGNRVVFALRQCAVCAFVMFVIGCHHDESAKRDDSALPTNSPASPAAQRADETDAGGTLRVGLSEGGRTIDPFASWANIEATGWNFYNLSHEEFVEATRKLLALRSDLGQQRNLNSLAVAGKIEDIVSMEVARRIKTAALLPADAIKILDGFHAAVFDSDLLINLVSYPRRGKRATKEPIPTHLLLEYLYEQAGGEDKAFEDAVGNLKATWFLESKKSVLKVSFIVNARRRLAATQGYLVFLQRGGDVSRQPLYKHIQEMIPDVLDRPVFVCPGIADEPLDAGDVERVMDGN